MTRSRAVALLVVLSVLPLALGACADSKKSDDTTTTAGPTTAGPSTGDAVGVTVGGIDAPWTLVASPISAKAGEVTFRVNNAGTIVHEVVVLKTDIPFDRLPIVDAGDPPAPVSSNPDKVDEGTSVGETGSPDLEAGGTRTFSVKAMKPGSYVLLCNIATHYGLGMRAAFTVS